MKLKLEPLFRNVDDKFAQQFGFRIHETTFENLVAYMFIPKDSSSLAVTRILFGICMLFDIPDERGGASLVQRWGDPRTCHFPLLPILQPMSLSYMVIVYCALCFGALGIALGYKYCWTSTMFTCAYWYLLLIDKSFWNNHSYLFGLVAMILTCTEANCYWSLDTLINPSKTKTTVPYWNYFILKYQFFILYFMAGLKKGTAEWLTGYSMQRLSEHWVFDPFKLFLTDAQTDYLIVHWFIFVFDLTIALWMMCSYTRNYAMVFCALFHLMNSRLFTIAANDSKKDNIEPKANKKNTNDKKAEEKDIANAKVITNDIKQENGTKKIWVCVMMCIYVCLQAFLPFSHFVTKVTIMMYLLGYNNWTNGLYGYSWDMMIHTWESHSVVIRVVDNDNNKEYFHDPNLHTLNDRWTRHGDMLYQYAQCIKNNIQNDNRQMLSRNISIYIDVWYSMNGRFTQRMFDPKVDMLQVEWSPFEEITYLMPLLDEAVEWRSVIADLREQVLSWSNNSNVIFIADFPGYDQEKFIPTELDNVTLTILRGTVIFELNEQSYRLTSGDEIAVQPNAFHKILNIGNKPAYYMYTFINITEIVHETKTQKLPIAEELLRRFSNMIIFARLVLESVF